MVRSDEEARFVIFQGLFDLAGASFQRLVFLAGDNLLHPGIKLRSFGALSVSSPPEF